MLGRIRDAENSQHVAELSQKISQLEMKVCSVVIKTSAADNKFCDYSERADGHGRGAKPLRGQ